MTDAIALLCLLIGLELVLGVDNVIVAAGGGVRPGGRGEKGRLILPFLTLDPSGFTRRGFLPPIDGLMPPEPTRFDQYGNDDRDQPAGARRLR
jgi:hypothetical protein